MIQSCIFLLLVAACSVHANGTSTPSQNETATPTPSQKTATPTPSQNETATPTPSQNETATPTPSQKETATPTPSQKETATPTPSQNETATPSPSQKETATSTASQNDTATSTCFQMETAISRLETAVDMIFKAAYKIPTCDNSSEVPTKKPLDCADVLEMGHKKSGVYEIWPVNRVTGGKHLYVYCDMETNGGGWTVIQRRGSDLQTPDNYFLRQWKSYKEGFGEIEKDFWLGNDYIFALTNQKLYSVRIDLKDFEENKRYALYDNFWIADEDHKYTLQISGYSGDAGNSMYRQNNQSFSTIDRDNDVSPFMHYASMNRGAWWYYRGLSVNLNGLFYNEKYDLNDGIYWFDFKRYESLAWTEMKIRPKNFRLSFS